jgi:hypothetical protein
MWMWLLVKISIYHTFIASLLKNSFFEMKIFKLVTWYPNMVHIMSNGMVQYTFETFIETKNHLNNFWSILVFLSTHYTRFHKYTPISHFIKWNEIKKILISCLGYILTQYVENILKIFQKFEVGYTQTCTSLESSAMWHPRGSIIVCFHPKTSSIAC